MTNLILVVDNDNITRLHLRNFLEEAGYRVAEANDGEQALVAYVQLQPDIVLLDTLLGKINSFTWCEQLRTLPQGKYTPVLMITALDDQASVERAFAVGATDVLAKPIQWQVLRQRVWRLLQASRAIEEIRQQTEQSQKREAQLVMALEAAQMGSWDWDVQNNNIIWSDNLKALFGLEGNTAEDIIRCIHPLDRDFVNRSAHAALDLGEDYDIEFRVVLPDNSIRWIASKGIVFRDSTGAGVRMSGVDIDITKRKQAEEALEKYATRQALVAELSQLALAGTELSTLMVETVALVSQTLKVEYCKVLELLPDGNTFLLQAGIGWQPGIVGNATVSADRNSQAGYTLLSHEPVVVTNLKTETRFNGPQLLHNHQVVSGISVIIHGKERPFGVLGVHTTSARTFSRDDIYFLQAVANVLATAIQRQRMEDALREIEERWQLALRGSNDGIWDWNVKTRKVFFSTRWKEMLGYSENEIFDNIEQWESHVHPNDIDKVRQLIQDHFAKKTPFYISEHRVQCKNGISKWILDRGQALWDEKGHAVRMVSSSTDITERKLAEEKLRQSEARSQLFADVTLKIRQSLHIEEILQTSVKEVQKLLQADRVLIFRLWSDGSGTVVQEAVVPGFPVVLGQDIDDPCFGEEYIQKYRQGLITAVTDVEHAGIEPCYVEFLQQLAIKSNLVVPIILKQNQLWGLLIAHQCSRPREWTTWEVELLRQLADQIGIALAQAKLLEQEILQRQELTRSNEELQQFAFIASHDLQEPLRKIKTFSERLKTNYSDVLTAQGSDYLERMQNAVLRMQVLIEDLLTLSRVTTRAHPFVSVDLAQITQEVLSDLEITLQQTQGRVVVEELPTIKADPLQMRQLLQNLIGNSLKFHRPEEPPVVKLYTQTTRTANGTEVFQIIVEDNGIGFDEKYLDRIFNVFQRLHGRSEYEGTGMGLAICRKIVERHQGSITATSKPGQGSSFIVTLPITSVF